jgi:hypothetical protein
MTAILLIAIIKERNKITLSTERFWKEKIL